MGEFGEVGQFHHKFGLDSATYEGVGPRLLPRDLQEFRVKFLFEELEELLKGLGIDVQSDLYSRAMEDSGTCAPNEALIFDALIDLVYVAYGLAQLKGYPWQEGWIAVQRANMAKERATTMTASERGGTWDIIKPPGWTAPDIEQILRDHGWRDLHFG